MARKWSSVYSQFMRLVVYTLQYYCKPDWGWECDDTIVIYIDSRPLRVGLEAPAGGPRGPGGSAPRRRCVDRPSGVYIKLVNCAAVRMRSEAW